MHHLVLSFIILIISILLIISLFNLRETFVYTNNLKGLTPYDQTTLSTGDKISNAYPEKIKSTPWYQPWSNSANKMVCYLDSHLNRKCFWVCEGKRSNNCN